MFTSSPLIYLGPLTMNIFDVKVDLPDESSREFWTRFMELRKTRFYAFCQVEILNEGLLQPNISLSTAKGQEAFRILAFRVIEELAEAVQAQSQPHQLEEMADAINYVLSIPYLDLSIISDTSILESCVFLSTQKNFISSPLDFYDLGSVSYQLGVETGDYLRNRAWTKNAQDLYFVGARKLLECLQTILSVLFVPFKDFDELRWYLIAKDEVLKFRIRTNY